VQRSKINPVIYDYRDIKIDYLNSLFLKRNTYYRKIDKQARGVAVLAFDKSFYNLNDIPVLNSLQEKIIAIFPEIEQRSTKKGLLSSKEKEVWICTCKTNEMNYYCASCKTDIQGFTEKDIKPHQAIKHLQYTIRLISEYLN